MKTSVKFRTYAEECRRLAKHIKPEHRAALREIADAWIRCAEEAERGTDKDEPSETSGEPEPIRFGKEKYSWATAATDLDV